VRFFGAGFVGEAGFEATNFFCNPGLATARICTASRPALRAPPMATVATGMPLGI